MENYANMPGHLSNAVFCNRCGKKISIRFSQCPYIFKEILFAQVSFISAIFLPALHAGKKLLGRRRIGIVQYQFMQFRSRLINDAGAGIKNTEREMILGIIFLDAINLICLLSIKHFELCRRGRFGWGNYRLVILFRSNLPGIDRAAC